MKRIICEMVASILSGCISIGFLFGGVLRGFYCGDHDLPFDFAPFAYAFIGFFILSLILLAVCVVDLIISSEKKK